jgi:hypothetical protein
MIQALGRVAALALCLALPSSALAGDAWGKATAGSWGKHQAAPAAAAGKRLSVEAPVVVGDLALYPVVDRRAAGRPELDVVGLGPAMAQGRVAVRELEGGVVSELLLVNSGDAPVLAMAGDVIHGGMQDRVIQRGRLVAAGQAVRVRVQCVERGRWTDRFDGAFAYAGRIDPGVREVLARGGSQSATWAAVAAANRSSGVSESASWLQGRDLDPAALIEAERALAARFADDKRLVGVVVARGGEFTGTEVYPTPDLFARDRMQVLSSHLVRRTAGTRSLPRVGAVPATTDAAAFLEGSLAAR